MTVPLNLLYVVLASVFNTKHSVSATAVQAFFSPQRASQKEARKQRANRDSLNDHPRVHRVSTALSTALILLRGTDKRSVPRCSFTTLSLCPYR